jgi:predicted nucleic acid-binding protein
MYAAGGPHPLREPCRACLATAVERRLSLVTDSEVLQEILYRYFSISRPGAAREVYRSTVGLCDEVLPVEEKHTSRALELLEQNPSIAPRDAIHVATMESAGIRRILTTDRDFDSIGEVTRVDPAELAL